MKEEETIHSQTKGMMILSAMMKTKGMMRQKQKVLENLQKH